MARGEIVTGDGTRFVAEIRYRSAIRSTTIWIVAVVAVVASFLCGVRFGTDGVYRDAVESLERVFAGGPPNLLTSLFAQLRKVDASKDPSRASVATSLVGINATCIDMGRKADEAWQTYFAGLRAVVNSEIGELRTATQSQNGLLKDLSSIDMRTQQQCSAARELLELILLHSAKARVAPPDVSSSK